MNKTILLRTALMQSLFENIQNEVRVGCAPHPPPDDAASKNINDEGDIHTAGLGGDIRKVRDPELVRGRRFEQPVDQIKRADICLVTDRGPL